MHRSQLRSIVAASALSTACASSDAPSAPPPPSLVDFTVYAVDTGGGLTTSWTGVSGASAFLDTAGGQRIEATAEADGKIVFHGVDFGPGPATITAYGPNRIIYTVAGVTPEAVAKLSLPRPAFPTGGPNLPLIVSLVRLEDAQLVKVTGTLKGTKAPDNHVLMSATGGRSFFEGTAGRYTIDVFKGAPLSIIATESTGGQANNGWNETKLRWLKFDLPAQNANATMDLDLETAPTLPPTKVTLTLIGPEGGKLGGPPSWQVGSTGKALFVVGSRSIVTPGADGRTWKAEGELVASPLATEPVMTVAIFPGFTGESALVQRLGPPADNTTYEALKFPKAPADTGVGSDITLSDLGLDPKAEAVAIDVVQHVVVLTQDPVDIPAWHIQTIKGAGVPATLHLPDLPDAARALLPPSPQARLSIFADRADENYPNVPGRVALSKFFRVKK